MKIPLFFLIIFSTSCLFLMTTAELKCYNGSNTVNYEYNFKCGVKDEICFKLFQKSAKNEKNKKLFDFMAQKNAVKGCGPSNFCDERNDEKHTCLTCESDNCNHSSMNLEFNHIIFILMSLILTI
uniref:Uncharacterized protein n=1 Tax=Panagrolaimus sp. JU765 TaxID=591449 RepID=A0AC34RP51_9BILA